MHSLSAVRSAALRTAQVFGITAAVLSSLYVSAARADVLSLSSGGTLATLSPSFDPTAAILADGISVGTPITIFRGPDNTGGLLVDPAASLTLTFMGSQAAYTNQVLSGNTVLFDNNTPVGTSATVSANSGWAPFLFQSVTPGNLQAINGGPIDPGLALAFARLSGSTFYAFLDDSGAGPDSDFNDSVVKISAADPLSSVPLPDAAVLFGSGLLGLVALAHRRKLRKIA